MMRRGLELTVEEWNVIVEKYVLERAASRVSDLVSGKSHCKHRNHMWVGEGDEQDTPTSLGLKWGHGNLLMWFTNTLAHFVRYQRCFTDTFDTAATR